jgi:hypothetical protein
MSDIRQQVSATPPYYIHYPRSWRSASSQLQDSKIPAGVILQVPPLVGLRVVIADIAKEPYIPLETHNQPNAGKHKPDYNTERPTELLNQVSATELSREVN